MKFNKKWLVYLAYLGTMALGLVLIVISPIGTQGIKSGKQKAEIKQTMSSSKSEKDTFASESLSPTLTPSPTPEISPTPTPLPVYPLERETYPSKIDSLISKYYDAKVTCDIETLKAISSNPPAVISKKSLEQLVEGIEEYRNIKCYSKKSYEDGAYIVYVYYEIKFISLNTCAPALTKLYIVTDEAGELKIFDGEMSEELKTYFDARSEDEDVKDLIVYTENRAEKAKEQDEKLKDYWNARN